jgi:hypothetical protein
VATIFFPVLEADEDGTEARLLLGENAFAADSIVAPRRRAA